MNPDHSRRRLLHRTLALLLGSMPLAARGPLPADLHEAGPARRERLFVVLFSLPDCPYCVAVRKAYLPALLDDPRFAERIRIREVGIGDPRLLKDFKGERVRHADLAHRYGVKFAPTVLFLDADGTQQAEPLLGGDSVGLYAGYLEKRVLQGLGMQPPKE